MVFISFIFINPPSPSELTESLLHLLKFADTQGVSGNHENTCSLVLKWTEISVQEDQWSLFSMCSKTKRQKLYSFELLPPNHKSSFSSQAGATF